MKKLVTLLFAALVAAACTSTPGARQLSDWEMQQVGGSKTYSVTVPTTVAGALHRAGELGENPLEQMNLFELDQTRFDSTWVFTTRFKGGKGHHILRIGGIGYSADILVNGTLIASADTTLGVFATREWDITPLLAQENKLEVRTHKSPWGSLNHGFVDWNPHALDEFMGLIAPVSIIRVADVQVQDVYVRPELSEDLTQASIVVTTTLVNRGDQPAEGTLKGKYEGGSFSQKVSLQPGETRVICQKEEVVNPRIWWPYDMGTPELYHLEMAFGNSHSKEVAFGLRNVSSEVDSLGHRQFYVNGRKILFKAAGWTDDYFMEDTPERTRAQLQLVKNMGLNGIRFENIWGKDDTVYDLCDQMGILNLVGWSCLWEWPGQCGLPGDPKYGCITTPELQDLAVRYFHDQLIRLRNHPAVIGWLTGSDMLPHPDLEARYLDLYKELEYRPYVCSAANRTSTLSGPSGVKMMGPYDYVAPDYWYIDTRNGGAYGFNTETGIGLNMPQQENVRRIVGEDHLWPVDEVWYKHCVRGKQMNPSILLGVVAGEYGEATGFEDFVRKAQAADYDGTRAMFEAFRCHIDHATGIVQWMLNSAWPALYWQLYDWYLAPTAGYYGTKKGNAPYQLIYNYGEHAVYAVNDVMPEANYEVVMKLYDSQSRLVRRDDKPVDFTPRAPEKVFEGIEGPGFLSLQVLHGEEVVATNFYCLPEKDNVYDWAASNWFISPIKEYGSLSFVTALPQASLSMEVQKADGGYSVTLSNASETIAYQNILKALDEKGQLIPAVLWSDNFFALEPGESRTVSCTLPDGFSSARIAFDGWNGAL
ncbi:MAG: glycoside hydrolase family 2 [Bacteroidales bacterium]|nr:glycoside hydrolase family 2 [Bacteroidales bacterium]